MQALPCPGTVYPRVCGGTDWHLSSTPLMTGLSPRVRGNLAVTTRSYGLRGSIPACAGEPFPRHGHAARLPVYPRVCGGTPPFLRQCPRQCGLSPRVRGNPPWPALCHCFTRSIPACAGEPASFPVKIMPPPVYPRVCGGTCVPPALQALRCGSIPACAGEPRRGVLNGDVNAVYPRVCGGTGIAVLCFTSYRGLSPRVRGNPLVLVNGMYVIRSIPACAGEPHRGRVYQRGRKVYPRVCGGTVSQAMRDASYRGLSPRVRGNRRRAGRGGQGLGSIPACAGEPPCGGVLHSDRPVYPRVCGGTQIPNGPRHTAEGLSPRVRGNRRIPVVSVFPTGSIPACAGEPRTPPTPRLSPKVYPRVCGGTCLSFT